VALIFRIGVLGDRRSSSIVKCLLGVRGVRGGSIIEGSIGGNASGVGAGRAISSFPGRSNVLEVIEGIVG